MRPLTLAGRLSEGAIVVLISFPFPVISATRAEASCATLGKDIGVFECVSRSAVGVDGGSKPSGVAVLASDFVNGVAPDVVDGLLEKRPR